MAHDTVKKSSPRDWDAIDVKAALHKRGITLKMIAMKHGLTSTSTLSVALSRHYPRSEARIAAALDLSPKDIWPSRYNEDGTPTTPNKILQSTAMGRLRKGKTIAVQVKHRRAA